MTRRRGLLLGFGLKILLPAVAAAAGIAVVMLSLLNAIFNEANSLDEQYAKRAAQAAISATLERMESVATDNALWDDAVRNAYAPIAEEWTYETWGVGTEIGLYNAAFVVDDLGNTLAGYAKGKKIDTSAKDYLGAGYAEFLQALPDDGKTFDKVAAIFAGRNNPMAAGAAVMLPTSEDLKLPQPRPNRLILAKFLDTEMLAGLATQYNFDDLKLLPAEAANPDGLEILDAKGSVVGQLTWTNRLPGEVARLKFGDLAKVMIGTLLLVMGALVYVCWRNYRATYESEERALHNASHDELSGLPNRRMLLHKLDNTLVRTLPETRSLAIVYADLDGFKEINDAYGHAVGDKVIRAAAAGFSALMPGKGMLARLAGDEFAAILEGPEAGAEAERLAQGMIAVLAEPFNFGDRIVSIGVSIGVVKTAGEAVVADELLRRADRAMYAAKTEGRNRACVYDPDMDRQREEHRQIGEILRAAVKAESLGVVYQPIVDARTRAIAGVEALARWPKDTGMPEVSPEVFVPVAEECGLIDEIGRFVLLRACRDAARWPGLKISVNVSPVQFKNPAFAHEVAQILGMSGLDRGRLELEVTEGSIIENARRATAVFAKLRELGVSVALDDFGTGYSSIGNLRQFAFGRLKIDRSMVKDITRSPSALRMMQAAVAMADSLALPVTAEGVEHEDQTHLLRLAGCSFFQGTLFSGPVEASAVTAMLSPAEDLRDVA